MNFFKKTLYSIAGLILLILLLEILFGLVFWLKDRGLEPMAIHDEPYLYYMFNQQDGTNEHGFKTDANIEKPEGTFRIILVGGSVARGKGLEETISVFLEDELTKTLDSIDIEVINAGMSGYVLQQEFLLTQMLLQYYQPNMIISLDGYNDLFTYKVNRFEDSTATLPPHNWSQFKVVEQNRYQKSFWSRISHLFKNITRFMGYFKRTKQEIGFRWNNVEEEQMQAVAAKYLNIANDTYFFCRAKHIDYLHFLQPIRYYSSDDQSNEEEVLSGIYAKIETQGKNFQFIHSLTDVLTGQDEVYLDDCHVTAAGNKVIAEEMAKPVANWIRLRVR